MPAIETPNKLAATAIIAPVVAAPFTEQLVMNKGVQSFVRGDVGQYRITLVQPVSFHEVVPYVALPANVLGTIEAQVEPAGTVFVSAFDPLGARIDPKFFTFMLFLVNEGDGVGPLVPVAAIPTPPAIIIPAIDVTYTPSVPADWNPQPDNVQEALDELAATRKPVLTAVRNVYVNPSTGSDANNGTAPGTPWLTLSKVKTDLESYGALYAQYVVHLNGNAGATITNVDLYIPTKGPGGSFNIVGESFTSIAGPFTATAGSATSITVAAGLGVNTYRAKTIRPLTGAAAVAGVRILIAETTDTVATLAGQGAGTAFAIGDTFEIIEPTVTIAGGATWRDATVVAASVLAPLGGVQTIDNFLIGYKISSTPILVGGSWRIYGIEEGANVANQLFCSNGSLSCGSSTTVVNPAVGNTSSTQWRGWGFAQPVGGGD